eukprot:gene6684-9168_t
MNLHIKAPCDCISHKPLQHFWKTYFPDNDVIRFSLFQVKLSNYFESPQANVFAQNNSNELDSNDFRDYPIPPYGYGLSKKELDAIFWDSNKNIMKYFRDAVDFEQTGMISAWQLAIVSNSYDSSIPLPQLIFAISQTKGQRIVLPSYHSIRTQEKLQKKLEKSYWFNFIVENKFGGDNNAMSRSVLSIESNNADEYNAYDISNSFNLFDYYIDDTLGNHAVNKVEKIMNTPGWHVIGGRSMCGKTMLVITALKKCLLSSNSNVKKELILSKEWDKAVKQSSSNLNIIDTNNSFLQNEENNHSDSKEAIYFDLAGRTTRSEILSCCSSTLNLRGESLEEIEKFFQKFVLSLQIGSVIVFDHVQYLACIVLNQIISPWTICNPDQALSVVIIPAITTKSMSYPTSEPFTHDSHKTITVNNNSEMSNFDDSVYDDSNMSNDAHLENEILSYVKVLPIDKKNYFSNNYVLYDIPLLSQEEVFAVAEREIKSKLKSYLQSIKRSLPTFPVSPIIKRSEPIVSINTEEAEEEKLEIMIPGQTDAHKSYLSNINYIEDNVLHEIQNIANFICSASGGYVGVIVLIVDILACQTEKASFLLDHWATSHKGQSVMPAPLRFLQSNVIYGPNLSSFTFYDRVLVYALSPLFYLATASRHYPFRGVILTNQTDELFQNLSFDKELAWDMSSALLHQMIRSNPNDVGDDDQRRFLVREVFEKAWSNLIALKVLKALHPIICNFMNNDYLKNDNTPVMIPDFIIETSFLKNCIDDGFLAECNTRLNRTASDEKIMDDIVAVTFPTVDDLFVGYLHCIAVRFTKLGGMLETVNNFHTIPELEYIIPHISFEKRSILRYIDTWLIPHFTILFCMIFVKLGVDGSGVLESQSGDADHRLSSDRNNTVNSDLNKSMIWKTSRFLGISLMAWPGVCLWNDNTDHPNGTADNHSKVTAENGLNTSAPIRRSSSFTKLRAFSSFDEWSTSASQAPTFPTMAEEIYDNEAVSNGLSDLCVRVASHVNNVFSRVSVPNAVDLVVFIGSHVKDICSMRLSPELYMPVIDLMIEAISAAEVLASQVAVEFPKGTNEVEGRGESFDEFYNSFLHQNDEPWVYKHQSVATIPDFAITSLSGLQRYATAVIQVAELLLDDLVIDSKGVNRNVMRDIWSNRDDTWSRVKEMLATFIRIIEKKELNHNKIENILRLQGLYALSRMMIGSSEISIEQNLLSESRGLQLLQQLVHELIKERQVQNGDGVTAKPNTLFISITYALNDFEAIYKSYSANARLANSKNDKPDDTSYNKIMESPLVISQLNHCFWKVYPDKLIADMNRIIGQSLFHRIINNRILQRAFDESTADARALFILIMETHRNSANKPKQGKEAVGSTNNGHISTAKNDNMPTRGISRASSGKSYFANELEEISAKRSILVSSSSIKPKDKFSEETHHLYPLILHNGSTNISELVSARLHQHGQYLQNQKNIFLTIFDDNLLNLDAAENNDWKFLAQPKSDDIPKDNSFQTIKKHLEWSIKFYQTLFGTNSILAADTSIIMGDVLRAYNMNVLSQLAYEKALKSYRFHGYVDNHYPIALVANALIGLASLLNISADKSTDSIDQKSLVERLLEEAISIMRYIYPDDHFSITLTADMLIQLLSDQKRLDKAKYHINYMITSAESSLLETRHRSNRLLQVRTVEQTDPVPRKGSDMREKLSVAIDRIGPQLIKLTQLYEKIGSYDKAIPCYEEIISGYRKSKSVKNSIRLADALCLHAKCLFNKAINQVGGRYGPQTEHSFGTVPVISSVHYQEVVGILKQAIQVYHEEVDYSLSSSRIIRISKQLAEVYLSQGDSDKARECFENIMELFTQDIATTQVEYARLLVHNEEPAEACLLFQQAIDTYRRIIKQPERLNRKVSTLLLERGSAFIDLQAYEDAQYSIDEAMALLETQCKQEQVIFGYRKSAKYLAACHNCQALLNHHYEEHDDALVSFSNAVQTYIEASMGESLEIANVYNNFATLYDDLNQLENAKAMYEKAMVILLRYHGRSYAQILITMENLKNLLSDMGLHDQYRDVEEHLKAIEKRMMQSAEQSNDQRSSMMRKISSTQKVSSLSSTKANKNQTSTVKGLTSPPSFASMLTGINSTGIIHDNNNESTSTQTRVFHLEDDIDELPSVIIVDSAILRIGNPLSWSQSKPYLQSVRLSGVSQFLNHYIRSKEVETPLFLWGDELEYGILKFNESFSHYDIHMNGTKIRETLALLEKDPNVIDFPMGCEWQPEFGSWMVEAVPRNPYGSYLSDLMNVEKSMQLRRKRLHRILQDGEIAPSSSNFPMLGVRGYPHTADSKGPIANSDYISDKLINPHPRFGALTNNIRSRRQSNVNITVPIDPVVSKDTIKSDSIHMDAMAFGMGCCCLQVTMQCRNEQESRFLHDQLAIFSPIMMALSASTPIFKGILAGTDTRWDVISQAVDDRTDAEGGRVDDQHRTTTEPDAAMVGMGQKRLSKSRYSSVSLYMGMPRNENDEKNIECLNDINATIDEDAYEMLRNGGVDSVMSQHIAHLFTRDPLVIFDDAIHLDNTQVMDHFENIQSTNWRSMRWKLPSLAIGLEAARRKESMSYYKIGSPRSRTVLIDEFVTNDDFNFDDEAFLCDDPVFCGNSENSRAMIESLPSLQSFGPGWRVEFRPLEVQLTDFENAAFSIIIILLSRCILNMQCNFYIPMSLTEENMRRAQLKDAAVNQKFWIRKNAFMNHQLLDDLFATPGKHTPESPSSMSSNDFMSPPCMDDIDLVELSLEEIFNGEKRKESIAVIKESIPDNKMNVDNQNNDDLFPGIIPLLLKYISSLGCNGSHRVYKELLPYLMLLSRRASGELPTAARWIRNFVTNHAEYKGDGKLSGTIADELLKLCDDVGMGRVSAQDLYGHDKSILPLERVDEEDLVYINYPSDACESDTILSSSSLANEVLKVSESSLTMIDGSGSGSVATNQSVTSSNMIDNKSRFSFVSQRILQLFKDFRKNIDLYEDEGMTSS